MDSPDLTAEGTIVRMSFSITAEHMAHYLNLSGDDNPLHISDAAAQNLKFKGRVVYGGLLVAVISRLLGTKLPGPGCIWQSLSINFRRPLYIDESAEIVATVTYSNAQTRVLRLKIEIYRSEELIADGQAQAGFPSAGSFKP